MPGRRRVQSATAMPAAVQSPPFPSLLFPSPLFPSLLFPSPLFPSPLLYQDNASIHTDPSRAQPMADEGEIFNLDNISDDNEEEEDHPPAPRVMAPTVPSPLQTVINSPYPTQTDLLATSGLTRKAKGADDVHFFYRLHPTTGRNVCILCERLYELDTTYKVTSYSSTTSNTGPHFHVYSHHTILYLEEAGHHDWPIQIKPLNALLEQGWMVTTIRERLRDPSCTMDSLGDVPNCDDILLGTRQSGSLKDEIPNFTVDEMHQQLAINVMECPKFRHLIRLLRPELNDSDICHCTKFREFILEAFNEYFEVLKRDLAMAQGKISFMSDLWLDSNLPHSWPSPPTGLPKMSKVLCLF
ncbi:uncharacterized protein EDB91DRAFT_1259774 [Suillus paluster]|uniref:uncharacterized protein n=1 Tax=Suillus paluster TaxID=48578 RepID=UPI001B87FEAE|nr:uncharacterized protein EDB91DRAFT_1259774 [Suillus paluster]KAG1717414.1 hypothetical protein EDB91DRAFT_1259774 [Suillus paluster]